MNKKFLPVILFALGVSGAAVAQKERSSKDNKDESIIIRKNSDSKDKTTIVIDGDQITVNGKPLDQLKDSDSEVLTNKGMKAFGRGFGMPMGTLNLAGGEMEANRAFLGVSSQKADNGVRVLSVEKESPAEKAGLQEGDIITQIGETRIGDAQELYKAIGKYGPMDNVKIAYLRDGKPGVATAVLAKSKSPEIKAFNFNGDDFKNFNFEGPGSGGMQRFKGIPRLQDMVMNRKPRLGLEIQDVEEGKGVKVLNVDDESPAAKAGLQSDDVISEVDGKAISSVDDLRSKTTGLKEGDSIKITYRRAGKIQTAELRFPKKLKTAEL